MSVLNAAGIAEGALETLGTFSVYDVSADPAEFDTALRRLQKVTAYIVATEKPWWFVPTRQTIPLEADKSDYIMQGLLSVDLQYVRDAWLINGSNRIEIDLLTKNEYLKRVNNPSTGTPNGVYVPRNDNPTLVVVPTPTIDGYSLELNGFGYSNDLTQDGGAVTHGFPEAWELCLMYQTAYDLGLGPITRLPKSDRDDIKKEGDKMMRALRAYNDDSNTNKPAKTAYRDI